jgi:hypothetical protein
MCAPGIELERMASKNLSVYVHGVSTNLFLFLLSLTPFFILGLGAQHIVSTTNTSTTIHRLPPELLPSIPVYLTSRELVSATHVCRR